jgi:PAS domain S-box-containing protein
MVWKRHLFLKNSSFAATCGKFVMKEKNTSSYDELKQQLAQSESKEAHIKRVLLAIRNVNQLIIAETDAERLIRSACDNLTETMGYHNAWIALMDSKGETVLKSAASGFDGGFNIMQEHFDRHQFPECMRETLETRKLAVVYDPPSECPDCPLSGEYAGRAGLVRQLAYGDKRYGILSVSVPAEYAEDLEEKELFDELADDLSFALYKIEAEERRKAAEETIIRQKAELEATLYGIGDGVIAADSEGCVARMNPTAERMTGWTEDEAKGRPLETIFQIINEKTGKPALNPVTQVLKKGVVVNLGNHTVLISKDGRKTPISDSGAPIYDARGEMTGVVLVFQDQTTERLQQKLLETRLSLIEYGLNHNMDGFLARALDEVGELADSPIGFYHFIDSDQKTLSLQQWSTRTKNDFCKADGKGLHHSINQAGVWVDCMHVKKPVIHNDYKKLPHKKGLPDGHADVVRELVVPVIRHGRIVSILGVGNKPCDYTKDDVGLVSYLADVIWEIVSKKQAEDALRDSERQKDLILNSANEMVAYYDKNLRIVWANRASGESVGKKPEDLIGMHCYEVWHQRNSPCENCPVIQARKEKVPKEAEQQTPDGRFWNIRGYPVLNDSGEVTALIEFGQDITDRKRAEELKKKELNEKRVLLRELYHRTKNNIQVISSMIRLRSRQVENTSVKDILREIDNKIQSMALVHKKLYESQELSSLNLNTYFQDLIGLIRNSYSMTEDRIKIIYKGADIPVLIDTAIPLGLVLNELLSNAYKHAFPGGRKGKIRVELSRGPSREIILDVSDNGIGLPPDFDVEKDGKLGLGTVMALGQLQLDGEVRFKNKKGCKCRVMIRKELHKPRV